MSDTTGGVLDPGEDETTAAVGRTDADADAARSGADVGPMGVEEHDTDGAPTGHDDAQADAAASGADLADPSF